MLLDEADTFVEQRQTSDVHRNALVCVFLRMLEYYSGILSMTTNRVQTFDDAVASRVHLPLRFDNLKRAARASIWKKFLNKAETKRGSHDLTPEDISSLEELNLNGREVRQLLILT